MKKIIQIAHSDCMTVALTEDGGLYSLYHRPNESLESKNWHKLPPIPDSKE